MSRPLHHHQVKTLFRRSPAKRSSLHALHIGVADSAPSADCVQIIGPGSVGLYPDYHNEEFLIEAVVYTPRGLVYRGKRLSQKGVRFEEVTVTAPVDRIVPIAGRSQLVWYNYDTGEILAQDRARKPANAMP